MHYLRRWLYAAWHPRYVADLEAQTDKLQRRLAYSQKMRDWYVEAHRNLKRQIATTARARTKSADGTPIRHGSSGIKDHLEYVANQN